MDLLNGSREDAYAFTHALMYVDAFPRPRRAVLAEAGGALARYLDGQDYDLAGELLLAWPLAGAPWSEAASFAFRVLARVEDLAGFLPTPSTRLARANALQGEARARYVLATAYHTAYVMGLLCAAALQPGRAPSRSTASAPTPGGVASEILPYLSTGGQAAAVRPHWMNELETLTDRQRDTLAGFLLEVALHRSVARKDFQTVCQLLALGACFGLADAPVPSQAAELLQRVSLSGIGVASHPPAT
jgi:hypothetical protein